MSTTTLWRPVGPEELALLALGGWRRWPPRLSQQPIFYPVLNRDYALRIARDYAVRIAAVRIAGDWNAKRSGAGYVTESDVHTAYFDRFEVHQVGGRSILECWIPAERLYEFNTKIVGQIRLVEHFIAHARFSAAGQSGRAAGR